MAVSRNNNSGGYRKKSNGTFRSGSSRFSRVVLRIAISIFIVLCLFGVINQGALFTGLWQWFIDTGTAIGHTMEYLFVGEDPGLPVDITDEGVYIDGYAPDSANKIAD